ncbi:MAG: ABC transporter permease subunit [Halanaerobium sp.]|nr:ABC transporter permease subunit [Halanaerobium sp.]
MKRFIIKRLLTILLLMWLTTVIIFVLLNVSGAGMERVFNIQSMSPFDVAREKSMFNIDRSPGYQYFIWLGQVLRGNFGTVGGGANQGFSITELIMPKVRNSVILLLSSIFLAVSVGFILGVFNALKPKHFLSKIIEGIALVGVSIPNFALGIILIIIFAVQLRWLPTSGYRGLIFDPTPIEALLDFIKHLILPAFTLAFTYIAIFTEHFSSSLKEVLNEEYIRTARSKGLPEWKVIMKHALRNSCIPVLAKVFASLPFFMGGLVVVEYLFSLQGVGYYIYNNMVGGVFGGTDFYVVLMIIGFSAVLSLIGSFLADLIYVLVDPRVKNPVYTPGSTFNWPGMVGLIAGGVLLLAGYHWKLYLVFDRLGSLLLPGAVVTVIMLIIGLLVKAAAPVRDLAAGSGGFSLKPNINWDRIKYLIQGLSRPAIVAGALVLVILFVSPYLAALAGVTTERDLPVDISTRYQPPSADLIMGADKLGRSELLLLIIHADETLQMVLLITLVGVLGGTFLGVLMGYFQGVVDKFLMIVFDLISAVPTFFVIFIAIGMAGNSPQIIIPVTAIFGLIEFAKVVRARVMVIREMEFVMAARALGNSQIQLITNHLLRNLLPLVWGQGIMLFGRNMILLSSLGYLRLLPPNTWGAMVGTGSAALYRWWLSLFPIALIFVSVIAVNAVGRGIIDRLDPFSNKVS